MDEDTVDLNVPLPSGGGGGGGDIVGPPSLEDLSPKEQAVLEEYERLAENMKKLATILGDLAGQPATDTLDGLRELERKTSLVFTLLKASVYSIVLQHQIDEGGQ